MPDRLIDVPIEALPAVDEHSLDVAASVERSWEGLLETVAAMGSRRGGAAGARALGCVHVEAEGEPQCVGSTIPGFVVARSVAPAVLALLGRHRFSRYALVFRLTRKPSGLTRVSAETRAEFPGAKGRVYRSLVIGTRGHVLATRSILRAVRRRAERVPGVYS